MDFVLILESNELEGELQQEIGLLLAEKVIGCLVWRDLYTEYNFYIEKIVNVDLNFGGLW